MERVLVVIVVVVVIVFGYRNKYCPSYTMCVDNGDDDNHGDDIPR